MEKRAIEFNGQSQETNETYASTYNSALAELMRQLRKITGALLGGIAISAQIGNILICLLIIVGAIAHYKVFGLLM